MIDEVRVAVENMHLARDHRGHSLVDDAEFNQVVDDKSEVISDGYMRATTVTEERRDRPVEDVASRNGMSVVSLTKIAIWGPARHQVDVLVP